MSEILVKITKWSSQLIDTRCCFKVEQKTNLYNLWTYSIIFLPSDSVELENLFRKEVNKKDESFNCLQLRFIKFNIMFYAFAKTKLKYFV